MHTFRADQLRQGDRLESGWFVDQTLTIADLGLTWVLWFTGIDTRTTIHASSDPVEQVRRR